MALTLENENKVWQRVNIALKNASPSVQNAFKALKQNLAQDFRNKDLQFVAFDKTTNGSDGTNADKVVADVACRLVAVYGKKGTSATASYLSAANHATAIQAQKELILRATEAGEEVVFINSKGSPYATGVTTAAVTAYNGTTHNAIAASFDGFAIVAAA